MWINYLKVGFRNLLKHKSYTLINLIGLTVGVAVTILLFFYVQFHLSFDSFHQEPASLYRVLRVQNGDQGEFKFPSLPLVLSSVIDQNMADRVDYTPFVTNNYLVKREGSDGFNQPIALVSSDFFEMFGFKMLSGVFPASAEQKGGVVLSEAIASKFFGDENPIGQELQIRLTDELLSYEVIGIIENPPANSSLGYEILMHDANLEILFPERMRTHWYMSFGDGYAKLKSEMKLEDFEKETKDYVRRNFQNAQEAENYGFSLQPLEDVHLNTEIPAGIASVVNPKILWILAGIALLIILIACINFTTMAIGTSAGRAREVGVRKTMGAGAGQLFGQFMAESIILTAGSLGLGLLLAELLLPMFNSLMQTNLSISFSLEQVVIFFGLGIFIAGLAGAYPALFLSSFQPAQVLKSALSLKFGKQGLRMSMLALQFFISMLLITCTLVMVRQMRTVEKYDLGAAKEDIIQVLVPPPAANGLQDQITKSFDYGKAFKNELRKLPEVNGVTMATAMYGNSTWFSVGYRPPGEEEGVNFRMNVVDEDFVDFFELNLVEGRNFSAANPSDATNAFLMNEKMKAHLGWEEAFGKSLESDRPFGENRSIGVLKDFHFESLFRPIEPAVMVMNPEHFFPGLGTLMMEEQMITKVYIKVLAADKQAFLEKIKGVWKNLYGSDPFDYSFVEDQIARDYVQANSLRSLVTLAAIVAIIIAGMGLFAMASLAISSRLKEIGIRRVMGATTGEISLQFNRQFLKITLIGVLTSIPVSYYLMNLWLQDFAVKTPLGLGIFLLAMGFGLCFSIAIVSMETIKAAWVNPTKLLKSE
ncbi:ABC transporter permease [Algoriphagus mannitolivorans]|uniref:ABC transporter permease n=1 Tax=Algoriphagus mannitolivorans TaxID=226504 RepID=UPI00041647F7|nr:ABC transporter permease [Algoriphagus mannitolivorans]